MMRATAAHLDLRGLAPPAAVLDVDALHRHLRTTRLFQDHLRTVIQIVATT